MRCSLRRSARLFLALGLVGGAVLLITSRHASAQPPRPPFGQGTHALRNLMKNKPWQLHPLTERHFWQLPEEQQRSTLLIVLGNTDGLDGFRGGLNEFVQRGGALLVATDRKSAADWQSALRVWVSGLFVQGDPSQADLAYRGFADCPFVRATAVLDPPIFQGLSKVATNRPSYLLPHSTRLQTLAVFPAECSVENLFLPSQDKPPPPLPFAVGGKMGKGRVLVLADHSVFINDMMLRDDNDNSLFAYNCLEWLTGRGKRKNVLFIEEGEVVTTFDVPLRDAPDPPIPPVAEMVNHVLAGIEDRDDVHNFLREHNVRRDGVLRYGLLLVTVGLIVYGLFRLVRARRRIETQMPLLETTLARQAPDMALVEQRHRAMLVDGNLWEAARDLARECFPAADGPARAESLPEITVQGDWWRQRRLRKQVQRLWQLAHADRPQRISALQFSSLAVQAESVRTAHAQGQWRMASFSRDRQGALPPPPDGRQA